MEDVVQKNLPITMVRENLEDLPSHTFPAGYSDRWYETGDENEWVRINAAADHYNSITPELFTAEFGTDVPVLKERQCFIVDARGHAIGTASAWFGRDDDPRPGRVHWVAIVPEEQGRGLAKPLMSSVCHRLLALGHQDAYLTTSTVRITAINLYVQFGFVPEVRTAEDAAIWEALRQHLRAG